MIITFVISLCFLVFKQCISQTLNYYLLFPTSAGAVCPGSVVHETDDADAVLQDDGSSCVPEEQALMLESNNMQVCVVFLIKFKKLILSIKLEISNLQKLSTFFTIL